MSKSAKTDLFLCALIAAAVFLAAFLGTTDAPDWGDDYAAYISEGIAIADGTLEEQRLVNYRYHASGFGIPPKDGKITYAWGYPLLIAGVYRLTGYDRIGFTSMRGFRMINVAALALFSGFFYLFCRRRFGTVASALLAVFLGTNRILFSGIDSYYSDIVFLFAAWTALLLAERFYEAESKRGRLVYGLLLGVMLWFSHETRSNGKLIAVFAAVYGLTKNRGARLSKQWGYRILPYALFLVLSAGSELLLGSASNVDGAAGITLKTFFGNLRYTAYTVRNWIGCSLIFRPWNVTEELPYAVKLIALAVLCVSGVGFLSSLKKEPHLALLLAGSVVGTALLPYMSTQNGRYFYWFLPALAVFTAYGFRFLAVLAAKRLRFNERLKKAFRIAGTALGAAAISACCVTIFIYGAEKPKNMQEAFSDDAIAVYRFITDSTDPSCTVLTSKPRLLRLNTGRDCIALVNGHTFDEADYYLMLPLPDDLLRMLPELERQNGGPLPAPVFESGELKLYRLSAAAN